MTRRTRLVLATGAALCAVAVAAVFGSADGRFLARASYEEARILIKRRPLERLIADPTTPAALKDAFSLVRDVRRFGADSLGLNVGGKFATYADVGHDTLVLVMSASPKDRLDEYQWQFPIVGRVPYKGFFDFAGAAREARGLEARGYDTYLRPSPAFSTLGWFEDPLLSTAMTRDRVSLAAMVLHELTHSTWYVPSQTPFDESLAEFTGLHGAELFFRARGDTTAAARAAAMWRDERRLEVFYGRVNGVLQNLYARHLTGASLDSGRAAVFDTLRSHLARDAEFDFEVYSRDAMVRGTLNNASVIAQRIYCDRLHVFDEVLMAHSGDLPATLRAIGAAVRSEPGRADPYQALYELSTRIRPPAR